jgi:hypothetical protein
VGGRSVHVIKAVLPIRKRQKLFLAASFLFFRVRLVFFWKFFFVFSESERAQGLMPFADFPGIFRVTP